MVTEEYLQKHKKAATEMMKKASLVYQEFRKDEGDLLDDIMELGWPDLTKVQKQSRRRIIRATAFDMMGALDK